MMCSAPNCKSSSVKRGMCNRHYLRWRRHGDPSAGRSAVGAPMSFYQTQVLPCSSKTCLIWPFARDPRGYAIVADGGSCRFVSRLACEAVNGAPSDINMQAAHSCGNGHQGCVNPNHLRWATCAENKQDMILHGRSARGRKNHFAVLTDDQVTEVRKLLGVARQSDIAEMFGIDQSTISKIATGKSWAWLEKST